MSGLFESIARRRRASASHRLGPSEENGVAPIWAPVAAPESESPSSELERAERNGADPELEAEWEPVEAPTTPEPEEVAPEPEEETQEPEEEAQQPADDAPPEPDAEQEPEEVAPEPEEAQEPAEEPEPAPERGGRLARESAPEPEPAAAQPDATLAPQLEAERAPTAPTFLERGRIRRRARYLRRLREIQLRDIGGFVLELQRLGSDRPDLVEAKLEGAASTDRELRALERALGEPVPLRELREAGVGGACRHCGAVYSSVDRFCAWCGNALRDA